MSLLKRKYKAEADKFRIVDYTKLHLNMLLYKSRQHYNTWVVLNENIPDDLKEDFKKDPKMQIPRGFWRRLVTFPDKTFFLQKEFLVPPTIIETLGFTEGDMILAREEYQLFDSEKEAGQCPFCRPTPGCHFMRILSDKPKEGTLERGGVCAPCIHLIWEENFNPVESKSFRGGLK